MLELPPSLKLAANGREPLLRDRQVVEAFAPLEDELDPIQIVNIHQWVAADRDQVRVLSWF
jgi:hypothetical protein